MKKYKWEIFWVIFFIAMFTWIINGYRQTWIEHKEAEKKHKEITPPGVDLRLQIYEDKTRGVVCYSLTTQSFSCVVLPKESK